MKQESLSDEEIVTQVLGGDRNAYSTLVSRYQSAMFAIAISRVRDAHDAEDLCQEALVRAYAALPTLRKKEDFGRWLFIILKRICIDFLRGKLAMARAKDKVDEVLEDESTDKVEAQERSKLLWTQVQGLDERSRDIITLHYGQGRPVREIAALEGCSESAVKMCLKRAREKLGVRLERYKEAWAVVPIPPLSVKVGKSIELIGPLKSLAVMGGPAILLGLLTGWYLGRDAERWRGVLSARAIQRHKRTLLFVALFFPAFIVAMALQRHWGFSKYYVLVPFLALPLFGVYLGLRDTFSFASRRLLLKQGAFLAYCAIAIAFMWFFPDFSMIFLGTMFVLQGFATDSEAPRCFEVEALETK